MGSMPFVRCKEVSNLSFEVMYCPILSDLTTGGVRIVMLMHRYLTDFGEVQISNQHERIYCFGKIE